MRTSVDVHNFLQSNDVEHEIVLIEGESRDVREAAASCGLSPHENQSGQFKGQTRMSKTGDGRLRKIFYMAALGAVRSDGLMYEYFRRRKAANDNGKVILSGVMRKLLYLIPGVVRSGTNFDENFFLANA